MGEPHVVRALREKRAEISGAILELEKRMSQHRADLVHLDATLRLFAPELEPESIAPKKPLAARSHDFATGELTRRCLEALRMAEGCVVAAEEIAGAAMRDKGLDPQDPLRLHPARAQHSDRPERQGHGGEDRQWSGRPLAPSGRTRRSRRVSALPVAAEVDRRAGLRHQPDHDAELLAVAGPAMILSEGGFLGVNRLRTWTPDRRPIVTP